MVMVIMASEGRGNYMHISKSFVNIAILLVICSGKLRTRAATKFSKTIQVTTPARNNHLFHVSSECSNGERR